MQNNILDHSEEASRFLKSMGNSQRLKILCLLNQYKTEVSVSELSGKLDLSMSALSQHLAKLRIAKLVKTRRNAQIIFYSLADGPAQDIINTLQKSFCNLGEQHD